LSAPDRKSLQTIVEAAGRKAAALDSFDALGTRAGIFLR
jgi:hypothetical protein